MIHSSYRSDFLMVAIWCHCSATCPEMEEYRKYFITNNNSAIFSRPTENFTKSEVEKACIRKTNG